MTWSAPEAPRSRRWRSARAAAALAWRASPGASLAMAALTVVAGAAPAAGAWTGKLLFDELAGGAASTGRTVALAVLTALAGAASVLAALAIGHATTAARLRIAVAVETTLFTRLNELPGIGPFEDPQFQVRLRLAEEGAQQAPQAVTQFVPDTVRSTITSVGFLAVLLVMYPPVAGLVLVAALAGLAGQVVLARRRAAAAQVLGVIAHRRLVYRMLLTDRTAVKEIRLFGIGELLRGRMTAGLHEANREQLTIERRSFLTQLAMTLAAAALSVLGLAIVARRAAQGQLSVGDVTLFVAALAAVQTNLSGLVVGYGTVVAALDQFGHYLGVLQVRPALRSGSRPVEPLRHGIELRDVWFRYDESGPWVLRGVTMTIPAGSAIGLVGANGAGKSTLVALLCRFYDPQRGQLRWDGTDLRELDVVALRQRVRATFQDFMRYDLSAAENIGVGDEPRLADRDRVVEVAARAEIDQRLRALPRGYDTLLSRIVFDDGTRQVGVALSGGQWQRVALARSMMREDTDLLILDEPSSGLDADAEQRVHATLAAHRRGRTSVLVSHRLSALRDADRIVVLVDGVVAEQGSHAELLAANGEYARLFRLQASGYRDEVPA